MQGSTQQLKIPSSKTFKGFTRELSRVLGHRHGDMKVFHESLQAPLSSINQLKTIQAKEEDGVVRLYSMIEKADPIIALNVVAQSLEEQSRQAVRLRVIEDDEEKVEDDEEERAGFIGAGFDGNLVPDPQRRLTVTGCQVKRKAVPPLDLVEITDMEELYFSNLYITGLPTSFGNLSNLVRLQFFYTTLKSLPSSIGRLSSLRTLSVNKSCLLNRGVPDSIGDLSNLRVLSLTYPTRLEINDGNNLGRAIARLSNIEILDLSGCDLRQPFTMPGNDNLLNVRMNDANLIAIPDWVYYAPNLSHFEATNNLIQTLRSPDIEEDEDGLPRAIFSNLLSLELGRGFDPGYVTLELTDRFNRLRTRILA